MLLSFCAKKVTKEGAFTGGVAILPPLAPLQTPKEEYLFGITLSRVNLRVGITARESGSQIMCYCA
jgi:hypothetical protein